MAFSMRDTSIVLATESSSSSCSFSPEDSSSSKMTGTISRTSKRTGRSVPPRRRNTNNFRAMSGQHKSPRTSTSLTTGVTRAFTRAVVAATVSTSYLGLDCFASSASLPPEPATTSIQGVIKIPPHFRLTKDALSSTKLILSNNVDTRIVHPTAKGEFEITDVLTGEPNYSLDIVHPILWFDPVLIDVGHVSDAESDSMPKITPYLSDALYGKGKKLKYPLELAPSNVKMYFEEREDFNILSLFKSPMVLMMAFMFGFVYLMPKLMPQMDEQDVKAVREGQGGSGAGAARERKQVQGGK
ncbi:unnamed protein product [Amoebophrya sp. A120]|nr:unnamed protein product [Amoebophrya sp. A120]|eukprot:GSA120T00008577001.1